MQLQVAPSLLSADFLNLGNDVRMLDKHADLIHLDVMDGTFVPNISFGFPVIEAVCSIARINSDAHLMVVHPDRWFERISKAGVRMLSFHEEAAGEETADFLGKIRSLGMKAGLAINPDIPVERLFPYIGKADYFLIMSVFAGFGGQKFIPESIERIRTLKAAIAAAGLDTPIEVDGGVNVQNAASIAEAGASILVAGSAVFKAEDPAEAIRAIRGV